MSEINFYEDEIKKKDKEIEELNEKIEDLKGKNKSLLDGIKYKSEIIETYKRKIQEALDELDKVGFLHGAYSKDRCKEILKMLVV